MIAALFVDPRGWHPRKRLSTRENLCTPPAFAEELINLAHHSARRTR